ncbi:MAG: (Fe-S)-binding protein, partial [Bacteroidia bacterium]|nr:(Fe-S)-binding protein [Bacteroidia bacterium]
IAGADECCGFGGTFSVNFEPISVQMADQKVRSVLNSGAEIIVSTDYACLMHLDAYIKKNNIPLRIMHLADVLASGW